MKIKYPKRYKIYPQQDYFKHLCVELDRYPDIEIVGEEDYSDLSINIPTNTEFSIILDRADPHGLLPDFDVDSLVDPKLGEIAMKEYDIPRSTITPTIAWANRKNNPSIANNVDQFDLYSPVFVTNAHLKFVKNLKRAQLFPIPISIPEEIFYFSNEKNLDVFFAGSICFWYPYRKMFTDAVINDKKLKSIILKNQTGSVMVSKSNTIEEYDQQLMVYADNLRRTKITLIDGGIFNYPVKKYIEAMSCGCLVLGPVPVYGDELGFVDGETMVSVNESNFKEKMYFYLNNDKEREKITKNAYDLYKERHTCKKSAERIIEKFKTLKHE